MKCDSNLLEDYVEGFLKEIEHQKVEAHLKSCENCQNEYKQLIEEQNNLIAQLNIHSMANSQVDAIMQRIQKNTKRKNTWYTLKITIISAAVIMLGFVYYYLNRTPNDLAQPIDEPTKLIETSSWHEDLVEDEQILNYDEPFLDVSIDQVVENGENYDIHYRVKFKDQYQQEQNNLFEQLLNKYHHVEVVNQLEDAQDIFFGSVFPKIQFAIRDATGQLILATSKTKDGELPLINFYSISGDNTEILGEWIYTTSVPKYTNPSTFEVLEMKANVFDLFEIEVNTAQLQPFQFHNVTYEFDSIEIEKGNMYLKISTEGNPENIPSSWNIDINNRLFIANIGNIDSMNGRTIYTLQFENFEQVPTNFKLVPLTVYKKQIDPIVLELQ